MGSVLDLNDLATILPSNATNRGNYMTWEVVSVSSGIDFASVVIDSQDKLRIPWGQTGSIIIRATIEDGLADTDWGFPANVPYTMTFTISVTNFIAATDITPGPMTTFAGVPLELTGTVTPSAAAGRPIEWAIVDNPAGNNKLDVEPVTGAFLDPATGRILNAQRTGTVWVRATVRNSVAAITGTPPLSQQQLVDVVRFFEVRVLPYVKWPFELQAMPGGNAHARGNAFGAAISSVGGSSSASTTEYGGGETITLTATSNSGYSFAGWSSTNGGNFTNAQSSSTQFTSPDNATRVYAYFTFTGQYSGGDTITVIPTPVHYFTHGTTYTRYSGAYFSHVTVRDYTNFSYVTMNGRTLTRNQHYTAARSGNTTEITLINGYLDSLSQGQHSLGVHFRDNVSVSSVFTIFWPNQPQQTYNDVYTSDWYFGSVAFVSARGWMTSDASDPNRFRPSDQVTQSEVIIALYRMAGSPTILNQHGQALQGRDAALEWVRANGILPTNAHFNLNSAVTRQDVALLLARLVSHMRWSYYYTRSGPVWADEWQIEPIARSAVYDLYRAGVINGRTSNTFVPLGNSTRAEFATMLQRFTEAVGRW